MPESDSVLGQISPTCNEQVFCQQMISAVNVATAYRKDIDETTRRETVVITTEWHSQVTPENLAKKWNIGLDTAKKTLKVMTQNGVRHALHPLF